MTTSQRRFKRDADYFFERIEPDVRSSLTTRQEWEVKRAINYAIGRPSKKLVDIRFSFPLLVARYYLVFFVGRDFRHGKRAREVSAAVRTANIIFGSFVMVCLISFLAAAFLALIYVVKCALGIDILPGLSLSEKLRGWLS